MTARDEALDLLEKMLPREHAKPYRELFSKKFDAYAHELAEKQRHHFGVDNAPINAHCDPDCDFCRGVISAADLIDPEATT